MAVAKRIMPLPVRADIVADRQDGLKFTRFTPNPDITDSEVTGKQELAFFIDLSKTPFEFEVSNDLGPESNFKPYDSNLIDRYQTRGGVDEWTLESRLGGHPCPYPREPLLDRQNSRPERQGRQSSGRDR